MTKATDTNSLHLAPTPAPARNQARDRARDLAALALLDEPTRRRLYEYVSWHSEPVGRDQAAAALAITRELAAFHLDRLVEAGLLDASYRRLSGRQGPGAGRPAKLYLRADRDLSVSFPERRYEVVAD